MLNIHILTAGANVHNIYKKIYRLEWGMDQLIVLDEKEGREDVADSINQMVAECKEDGIPIDVLYFENGDLANLMEVIIDIRKQFPVSEAKLYFNITSGRKDVAIITFIGSLWTSGIGYYIPEKSMQPIVLPAPRLPLERLQKNKLFQRILKELEKDSDISQSTLRNKIKVNPNNHKDLSLQTLSPAIQVLEDAGLVIKQRPGRESMVSLTLAGRVAISVLKDSPKPKTQ